MYTGSTAYGQPVLSTHPHRQVMVAARSSASKCYLMARDKEVFWHCSLKGRTTQITAGKAGQNPRHYPTLQHPSSKDALKYVTRLVKRKTTAGFVLRDIGYRKYWTKKYQWEKCSSKGRKH